MKTVKIRFSALTHMGNKQFATSAGGILMGFQQHTDIFGSPPVSNEVLDIEIKKLIDLNAWADGPDGSHNIRNDRRIQRSIVQNMLELNGQYVLGIANTKETYIQKKLIVGMASYPLAHDTRSPVEKTPVSGLKVKTSSIPGIRHAQISWKKGKCNAFLLQVTNEQYTSDTVWNNLLTCAKPNCEITLEPGTWWVRVVGVYNSGYAEPCNPIAVTIG